MSFKLIPIFVVACLVMIYFIPGIHNLIPLFAAIFIALLMKANAQLTKGIHDISYDLHQANQQLDIAQARIQEMISFIENGRHQQPEHPGGRALALARLGFPPDYRPSADEVQKARKRLLRAAHPDGGGDEKHAASLMAAINEAADLLQK